MMSILICALSWCLTVWGQESPIVALFLGDGGSPWSQQMEADLLGTPRFQEMLERKAELWPLSLEEQEGLPYRVDRVPSILLLDPRKKEFARLEYTAASPEVVAQTIVSLIHDFQEVCSAIDRGVRFLSESELRSLYLKASRFSVPCFWQLLLTQGLKKEKGTFFHLEKYALLLKKPPKKKFAMERLKKELMKRDPATQGQMALLEQGKLQ
jgi:hypothetical protein